MIGKLFPQDSKRIASIQHDCYDRGLAVIWNAARDRYTTAVQITGVETELYEHVLHMHGFDHRTIQWFHDALAGQFRYLYVHQPDLFESPDHPDRDEKELASRWMRFLQEEMTRLLDKWPLTARHLCEAACYPNPDKKGIQAEEELYQLTMTEFPFLNLKPWSN